jgi:hypothetical protein
MAPTPPCGAPCAGWAWLRAADRGKPARANPRRTDACRRVACAAGRPVLAALLGRAGQQGPPLLLVGWIELLPDQSPDQDSGQHPLLIRRNDSTGELAYLRCYAPEPTSLAKLVRVAGQRWRVEESFQAAKGLTGLDQHQVRRWVSWQRWTTLAMLAHAFLAVATAIERDATPTPAGLIQLTVNDFRRLFEPYCSARNTASTHFSPGRAGAENIKPAPVTATADDENTNDHELRLSYYFAFWMWMAARAWRRSSGNGSVRLT